MPFEGTPAYLDNTLGKYEHRFGTVKEFVRQKIDIPMLQRVFPAGTVLREVIVAQITSATYYLPISAVSFGLILMGLAYGLTGVIANLANGLTFRRALVEPGSIFIIVLFTVLWLR